MLRSFFSRAGEEEEEKDRRKKNDKVRQFNISTSMKVSLTSRVLLDLNSEELSSLCVC